VAWLRTVGGNASTRKSLGNGRYLAGEREMALPMGEGKKVNITARLESSGSRASGLFSMRMKLDRPV